MNVLFYAAVKNGVAKKLQQEVEEFVPEGKREVHRTIDSLSRSLSRPADELNIAVLLAVNMDNLLDLIYIRSLLSDVRVILILPDRKDTTIAIGHTLHPRFLSYADSNFKDVGAVLKKMMGIYQ